MAAALLLITLCLLFWRGIVSPRLFGIGVVLFAGVELAVLAWQYNPVTRRSEVYPNIPVLSVIEQESQPYRTLSTDLSMLPPNSGAAYRVAQVEGYDLPVFGSFYDIYKARGGNRPAHWQLWSIDFPLVDWLNVSYVISPEYIQKDSYTLVLDLPAYKVYRNENAYPRAYMVYDFQVIEDQAKLLEIMVSSPEILKTTALFTELPPQVPEGISSDVNTASAEVNFVDYRMDQVTLEVNSAKSGFLVMSDLYTGDWKAKIDGEPAQVLEVDYAYRAVYLDAGQHLVEFYYQPMSFTVGVVLSLAGFIALFILVIYSILVRKNRSEAD